MQFCVLLLLQVNLSAENMFPSFCPLYPAPVLGGVCSSMARKPVGLPACIPQRVLGGLMSLDRERLVRLGWESSQAGVPSVLGEGLCLPWGVSWRLWCPSIAF